MKPYDGGYNGTIGVNPSSHQTSSAASSGGSSVRPSSLAGVIGCAIPGAEGGVIGMGNEVLGLSGSAMQGGGGGALSLSGAVGGLGLSSNNHAASSPHFKQSFAASSRFTLWDCFEKGDKIGEGTYGWVYRAKCRRTGSICAIKQLKAGREGDGISPTAIREILLLRELRHPHVIRLQSVHINRFEASLWLAFEFAEFDLYEMVRFHRDMKENIRDNPYGLMPQYTVKSILWQLLDGINYLHQNWILHRDLKPSNVLVMSDVKPPPSPSPPP
mmetsp:Transcript_3589/g.6164  ORF Transcript_3589/g.6164 Transcript_3589/m.6164 type:complete len:272 (+) Transcript_3589:67-882(+)